MFARPKCLKCDKPISHLDEKQIETKRWSPSGPLMGKFYCTVLRCPQCEAAIGTLPDLKEIKEEIVQELLKALGVQDKRKKP
jgi:hypothetical protein